MSRPHLQLVPLEEMVEDAAPRRSRFDGQVRCEHGVPIGLHAAPGRTGHDCAYTNARTTLIPAACEAVKASFPQLSEGSSAWCEAFGDTMDRMVRETYRR